MKGWTIVAAGIVFCAGTSFLGDTSSTMGAVTQSWVPYVAVPFAVGFAAVRTSVVRAGLIGALSSLALVVAFYVAGNPARTGGYSVDTDSIFSEYGPLGLVTGFVLAASARCIAPRVVASSAIVLAFGCAVIACAVYTLRRPSAAGGPVPPIGSGRGSARGR